jgi:hypothetical protein
VKEGRPIRGARSQSADHGGGAEGTRASSATRDGPGGTNAFRTKGSPVTRRPGGYEHDGGVYVDHDTNEHPGGGGGGRRQDGRARPRRTRRIGG